MSGKLAMTVLVALLAGWSVAQAFPFCFSFGGGSLNRADFYNRPPPAMVFSRGAYYAYPHSPVYPAPAYMPYYQLYPYPVFYGGRMPQAVRYR